MPLVCRGCENKTQFSRRASGRAYFTCTERIDESGDVYETDDYDYDDYDTSDWDSTECESCGSSDVEDVEQDVWDSWEGPEEETPDTWRKKLLRKTT